MQKTRLLSIQVILITLFLIFIFSNVLAQEWGKVTDEEWAIGAPTDYPEASAIILFHIGKIEVTLDRIKIEYHIRIKILDQAGAEDAGEWSIEWNDKYDKIKNFKAHTITPDGKKHKIDKKTVFESETGDFRRKSFAFSKLSPGVILEYKYTHKSERFRYLRPWYFQNHLYTMLSQVTAGVAPGFSYAIDFSNVPGINRSAKEDKYLNHTSNSGAPTYIKTFTWKMENIPPITEEPYMSAIDDYRAFIRFQLESFSEQMDYINFIRTWPEEGDWFRKYRTDDFDNAGSRVKKLTEQITSDLNTPKQKSIAIYNWVTDSISTIWELSNKWFYQKNIDHLLDERVGFGEDKNYLIAKMHNAAGIDAWPVLISTRSNGKFNPHQGDIRQFNCLITFVQMGNEWSFIDASGRYTPYGILPPNYLTEGGLLLDGSNSDLVKMVIKPAESNRYDSTMIVIDSAKQVTGKVNCLFTGYYAAAISQIEQKTEKEEFIDKYFRNKIKAECEWENLVFTKDSLDNLTETIQFSSSDMITELGDNILINPIRLAFGENIFDTKKRFFPVDFMYPFNYINQVDIVCQTDFSEIDLPPDTSFNIPGAVFVRQCTQNDSIITVITQLRIEQPLFEPRQYSKLREFFEMVVLTTDDPVTFIR